MKKSPWKDMEDNVKHYLSCQGYSLVENSKECKTNNADISFRLSSTLQINNMDIPERMRGCEFPLPLSDVTVERNIISVNVDRTKTFLRVLQEAPLRIDCQRKILSVNFDVASSEEDLTNYRIRLLGQTLKNLSIFLDYELVENAPENNLYLSSRSNFSVPLISNQKLVLCGSVLDSTTKSKETVTGISVIRRLKKEMVLREMELKSKINENVAALLVDAVLKFDCLCVKANKNVHLRSSSIENGASGSVIFIMYNYSRLNAILHEFESRVIQNYYPPLPAIEEINFSVLKKEEEWKLLRNFIVRFPTIVLDTMRYIEAGKPAPHLLCQFLYALARVISSYYRNTKILLDRQASLMKLTFARIQLIKAVQKILLQGLKILDIEVIPAL